MNKFLIAIAATAAIIFFMFVTAFFGGIAIWWLWPHVIPNVFPKIVNDGYLAKDLTLFQSIGLCWIMGILVKSSNTTKEKK
jgi:hypothetical protein